MGRLTAYYAKVYEDYIKEKFDSKLRLTLELVDCDKKKAVIKIGMHDGVDFVILFDTVTIYKDASLHIVPDSDKKISSNIMDWLECTYDGMTYAGLQIEKRKEEYRKEKG